MIIIALISLLATSLLSAEYYVLDVSKLKYDKDELGIDILKEETDIDADPKVAVLGVRLGKGCRGYIANLDHLNRKKSVWEHKIAIDTKKGSLIKGSIDIPDNYGGEIWSVAFELDTSKLKPSAKKEYDAVKAAYYGFVAGTQLKGSLWFELNGEAKKKLVVDGLALMQDSMGLLDDWTRFTDTHGAGVPLLAAMERKVQLQDIDGIVIASAAEKPKGEIETEVIAQFLPVDQYYLYASSLSSLDGAIGQFGEGIGKALVGSSQFGSLVLDLPRYEKQMLFPVSKIAKAIQGVEELVVTGADIRFVDGADIACVLRCEDGKKVFKALQDLMFSGLGEVKARNFRSGKLLSVVNSDRSISSYLLWRENLVVVSNSLVQLERLADVWDGKSKNCAASGSFMHFRKTYPVGKQALGLFISAKAAERWLSPQMRIASSRRVRAYALMVHYAIRKQLGKKIEDGPYTDLLGKLNESDDGLDSEHFNTRAFLTPAIELEIPNMTQAEGDAYSEWKQGIEEMMTNVDFPLMAVAALQELGPKVSLSLTPLMRQVNLGEAVSFLSEAGLKHRAKWAPTNRVGMKFAIDSDKVKAMAADLMDVADKDLAWLGEEVELYVEDHPFLHLMLIKPVSYINFSQMAELPFCLKVERRKGKDVKAFLKKLRKEASSEDVLLEMKEYKGVSYDHLSNKRDGIGVAETYHLYWCFLDDAWIMSTKLDALKRMIDVSLKPQQLVKVGEVPLHGEMAFDASLLIEALTLDARVKRSFAALPLLSEWQQQGHFEGYMDAYQKMYGRALLCLSGDVYAWNDSVNAIASKGYGSPFGANWPEYKSLLGGMSFVDAELRMVDDQMKLDLQFRPRPYQMFKAQVLNQGGKLLGEAKEYLMGGAGTVIEYDTVETGIEEEGIKGTEVVEILKKDAKVWQERVKITSENEEATGNLDYVATYDISEGLRLKSWKSKEGGYESELASGEEYMPKVLKSGYFARSYPTSVVSGWSWGRDIVARDVHLEKVKHLKTPFGIVPDVVKLTTRSYHVYPSGPSVSERVHWIHKDFGVLKFEEDNGYSRRVGVLKDIRDPKKK